MYLTKLRINNTRNPQCTPQKHGLHTKSPKLVILCVAALAVPHAHFSVFEHKKTVSSEEMDDTVFL